MMDYCARESTLNDCVEEVKNPTIGMDIRETYHILCDMNNLLQEFAQLVNGKVREDKIKKDAGSLWEESRMLTALAYENMEQLKEIKGSII